MKNEQIESFLKWEQMSRDTIDVKKCYIDIAGDLVAGILLSQIIYWFLPSNKGNSKLGASLKGEPCLAKNRDDWWNECRITGKQYDRAIKVLMARGLVKVKNSMFGGKKTPFIILNWEKLSVDLGLTPLNNGVGSDDVWG